MCIGLQWIIITIVLIGILTCSRRVEGGTITIDLEKNFCESRQSVSDHDVYHIIANPRSDLPSGRDHCNVYFTANPPIRKFYLYIKKIQIADCGVSLKIYDGDPALKNHRWSLSCKGPPQWKLVTWYGNIVIRLEKYTSESSNIYDIDVVLTTDQGPLIDTGTDANMESVSTGAIVGIAVGAGAAVIFIVGFILFCICRMYRNDKQDKKYPSTVFSTAPSRLEHGFLKPGSSRASSTGHHVEFLGIGANEGRAVSSRYSATGSYRTRSSHSYENSAYSRSEDESSTDVVDGKFSASPSMGMRKKTDQKEPVSNQVSSQRQSSVRKKNDTKLSTNSRNPYKSQNFTDTGSTKAKQDDKEYKQKRTNDDDQRSKSLSKASDKKEQSLKESYRDKKQENGKSRLYEPGKKHYSDDDDDYTHRQKINRRVSSRSVDNRGRTKYDREYNSSTSQGSVDYRDEIKRSTSRRRHRDDPPENRYRERSESRSRRHGDTRERSHSMSRSSRDRQYHDSNYSSRKRSRSETRSRSKSYNDDRYYRDRDREYDDRRQHDRHHRDYYRDSDHHSYSDSRHIDDRARSLWSWSKKRKYRRPVR